MSEWVGGRNPVLEVLRAGRREVVEMKLADGIRRNDQIKESVRFCQGKNIPITRVARRILSSHVPEHQGIALNVSSYPYASLAEILEKATESKEAPFILILDTLQDPQNVGTLLRTAEIVGVDGILLPLRRTATVTPAVVRASAGASEHLLIAQANVAQAINQLKETGFWVLGLDMDPEAISSAQVPLDVPLAVVVGSEGSGIRRLVRDSCDGFMRLPMRGRVGSLNAAVAGSVGLYFIWQARGFPGVEPPDWNSPPSF